MKAYYRFRGQFITDTFIDVIADNYDEAARIAHENLVETVSYVLRDQGFYDPDITLENTEPNEEPSTEYPIEEVSDWALTSENYPDDPI